jgi:hypothetical protein
MLLRDQQYLMPEHRAISPIHIIELLPVAVLYSFHFEGLSTPNWISLFDEITLLLVNPYPITNTDRWVFPLFTAPASRFILMSKWFLVSLASLGVVPWVLLFII